jgi:hypothetical protein
MKSILQASFALLFFSLAIAIFQMSCKKDAIAQTPTQTVYTLPPATTSTLGGVIVGNGLSVTSNGTLSLTATGSGQQNKLVYRKAIGVDTPNEFYEIWTSNFDGSSQQKVNINLPVGTRIGGVGISPDGKKLFLDVFPVTTGSTASIYSCNIDGSGLIKILTQGSRESLGVVAAF